MTTFSITPGAPYRISVSQPQVAGTPTPSISYAWSLAGVPIGSGRIINYTFDGDGLPATLRCVITLSNVAGSVSRTLEATIQAAANLPILNAITIRDNATPTTIINSIANGTATLRVGGPTSADLNPTGTNFTSISYQWRRGGAPIPGATNSTYTLSAADNNQSLSLAVTASNASGSATRTAIITVGSPVARAPIGDHLPPQNNNGVGTVFVNLIYSGIRDVRFGNQALIRNSSGQTNPQNSRLGRDVLADDWGERGEYFTVDGWPYRQSTGAITSAIPVRIELALTNAKRLFEILGLPDGEILDAEQFTIENGKLRGKNPEQFRNRSFTFDLNCYWEGQGRAVGGRTQITDTNPTTTTVVFAGPDGDGPYGDGPRTMSRTVTGMAASFNENGGFNAGEDYFTVFITDSDATGVNPLRNLMVMVTNVRDAATGELIFAGFDHTTYKPFQLYPKALARFQKVSHLRSLQNDHARDTWSSLARRSMVHDAVRADGVAITENLEKHDRSVVSDLLIRTVWDPVKDPSGYEKGFGAINRPTHACFGSSLRAIVEVCRQAGCGLWWCHPTATVKVSSVSDGVETYATEVGSTVGDATQTGTLSVWEDYAAGFAAEIERMPEGVPIYSEYANENWNTASSYNYQNVKCFNYALRAISGADYGGDGDVFCRRVGNPYAVGAGGVFAGTITGDAQKNASSAILAGGMVAGCVIAKEIRQRSNREIVCVGGLWSARRSLNVEALAILFARAPVLMKQLDAIADAPYRNPVWWDAEASINANKWMRDQSLVAFGSGEAVWAALDGPEDSEDPKFGETRPYTDPQSLWDNNGRLKHFRAFKALALDQEYSDGVTITRKWIPNGWPASQRRWNLKALAYEGGSHWLPGEAYSAYRTESRRISAAMTLHPLYEKFQLRYMETMFSPGPRGLLRDAANAIEGTVFNPGKVPAGVQENVEPLYGCFTHILGIDDPGADASAYWGMGWWFGHDSPQLKGNDLAVARNIGLPNWWVNYDFGA